VKVAGDLGGQPSSRESASRDRGDQLPVGHSHQRSPDHWPAPYAGSRCPPCVPPRPSRASR
jgi:hypothetical protein